MSHSHRTSTKTKRARLYEAARAERQARQARQARTLGETLTSPRAGNGPLLADVTITYADGTRLVYPAGTPLDQQPGRPRDLHRAAREEQRAFAASAQTMSYLAFKMRLEARRLANRGVTIYTNAEAHGPGYGFDRDAPPTDDTPRS